MFYSQKETKAYTEALRELRAARDQLRLKAHLLSMDARDQWQAIEAKIQSKLALLGRGVELNGSHRLEAAAKEIRELKEAVVDFARRHLSTNSSSSSSASRSER